MILDAARVILSRTRPRTDGGPAISTSEPSSTPPAPRIPQLRPQPADTTERRVQSIKRRVVREATVAVSMLESALDALRRLDVEAAREVRRADDQVDFEEVAIEQECYELLALHHPFGKDFRILTFCLRANADIERVADHASSIAKVVTRIADLTQGRQPAWPTAMLELADRVPHLCHELLSAVLSEDIERARAMVVEDKVIDQLDRRLFDEVRELVRLQGRDDDAVQLGMLIYRVGRELERVGDLMAAVAEDVVYLGTGQIIRHQKRRDRQAAATRAPGADPAGPSA